MSSSNIINEILTTLSMDYAMEIALEMQKKESLKSSWDKRVEKNLIERNKPNSKVGWIKKLRR